MGEMYDVCKTFIQVPPKKNSLITVEVFAVIRDVLAQSMIPEPGTMKAAVLEKLHFMISSLKYSHMMALGRVAWWHILYCWPYASPFASTIQRLLHPISHKHHRFIKSLIRLHHQKKPLCLETQYKHRSTPRQIQHLNPTRPPRRPLASPLPCSLPRRVFAHTAAIAGQVERFGFFVGCGAPGAGERLAEHDCFALGFLGFGFGRGDWGGLRIADLCCSRWRWRWECCSWWRRCHGGGREGYCFSLWSGV